MPDYNMVQLRREISAQLETKLLPLKYSFVRGVGRHFTEVSTKKIDRCRFQLA